MKSIFSIGILFFSYFSIAQAKEVILISYHPSQVQLSNMIKKIMLQNMDFPEQLVAFVESESPCIRKEVSAAHICLKENGEMDFPIIYTQAMKETLGIFWKDVKVELENK